MFEHTESVTRHFLINSIKLIDEIYGLDYARKNPKLVADITALQVDVFFEHRSNRDSE